MFSKRKFRILAILLLAAAIRLYGASYGVSDPCLAIPEEYWLYDNPQVSSLYGWDTRLPGVLYNPTSEIATTASIRTIAQSANDLVFLRLAGVLLGVLAVAITIRFALNTGANWWPLAGVFVACGPWFVESDKWLIRFDLAPLAVATSALLLQLSSRSQGKLYNKLIVGIQIAVTLSLLLIAPPLWWLAIGLLFFQPQPKWRIVVFGCLIGLVTIPALQNPWLWFGAAQTWDLGTVSACIWGLLAACLYRWPVLPAQARLGFIFLMLVLGGYARFLNTKITPAPSEWALIHWLQDRLPDDAIVRFDASTWRLAPIVACPKAINRRFVSQGQRVEMPFLAGPRPEQVAPNFIVGRNEQKSGEASYVYRVAGYSVERMTPLPNATDIRFGDILHILGYQLVTQKADPGDLIDIRLDYQFSSSVNVDALRYSAFIHILGPDSLTSRIVNYNVPFVAESGNFGPRRVVLNQHFRLPLPAAATPGNYAVVLGFYDVYTGERLRSELGDTLQIGQFTIGPV